MFAADEYAFIAHRLKEIREQRERTSGVASAPLPEAPKPSESSVQAEDDMIYAYC